jgi:catechol 2,3-dioxygenase-like lactoylglutathione lyase family enzyme
MKLNHLDLQVADVPALIRFFVDHFDLRPLTRLDSPRLAILTEDAGFTLVVQQCETGSTREAATDVTRARSTDAHLGHIGFLVDEPAQVHARLVAAGVAVSPVDHDARSVRCYLRVHGVLIEVGCNIGSRVATHPVDRGQSPPSEPSLHPSSAAPAHRPVTLRVGDRDMSQALGWVDFRSGTAIVRRSMPPALESIGKHGLRSREVAAVDAGRGDEIHPHGIFETSESTAWI